MLVAVARLLDLPRCAEDQLEPLHLTGAFLIVIAAGVLAYVHDLQEARFLPGLNNLAFDVSGAIPPTSWYGTLLKGVFNFSPATTVLEAAAWLLYFVPTMTIFLYQNDSARKLITSHTRASWGVRKEMIMTDHAVGAANFALPARTLILASSCAVLGMPLLAGCTDNTSADSSGAAASANPRALTVQATDAECKLSRPAPLGTLTFAVTNGGQGDGVLPLRRGWIAHRRRSGEHRPRHYAGAGPEGRARELHHACKPGMVGDGIRAPFSVSDSGDAQQGSAGSDAELEQANQNYRDTSKTKPSIWCR